MTGYSFTLTCPACDSLTSHVNGAGEGSQTVAVAQCDGCGREYVVTVHLRALPGPTTERDRLRKRRLRAGVAA